MMRKILENKQEIVGDVSYDLNFPRYHKRSHYLLNLPSLHPPDRVIFYGQLICYINQQSCMWKMDPS